MSLSERTFKVRQILGSIDVAPIERMVSGGLASAGQFSVPRNPANEVRRDMLTVPPAKLAVFLDRDGVLNQAIVRNGRPYPPRDLSELVIAEGARGALDELKREGFLLIVVTNQPDIARGMPRAAIPAPPGSPAIRSPRPAPPVPACAFALAQRAPPSSVQRRPRLARAHVFAHQVRLRHRHIKFRRAPAPDRAARIRSPGIPGRGLAAAHSDQLLSPGGRRAELSSPDSARCRAANAPHNRPPRIR